MSVHRQVQKLEFYRIISRPRPISHGCPSNAHLELWSLSTPLSAKLCSMSMHRSDQMLEFYRIISRLMSIIHSRGTLWRAVVYCLSNAHLQLWSLSAPLQPLLSSKLWSVHRSVQKLEFYRLISRVTPISYTRAIN